MNLLARIAFPVAVTAFAAAGALDFGHAPVRALVLEETALASESSSYVFKRTFLWHPGRISNLKQKRYYSP